ncbi:Serine/threonine-protein kinase PknD [Planctomycetes bacterium MalM25]|nr:Serine/threonine-protein kinase PknD [Planctomycetes bacterium MalM25]
MPNCQHCDADLPIETLHAGEGIVCPACGKPIDIDEEAWNLSSQAGGSPADATMQLGHESDSSLAGSSLAGSGEASEDLGASDVFDATLEAASDQPSELPPSDAPEETLAYGGGRRQEDDDSFDFDDDEDDDLGFVLEDDDSPADASESLDATIQFGHLHAADDDPEDEATIDLAGPGGGGPPALASGGDASDATMMADSGQTPSSDRSVDDASGEAGADSEDTVALDSGQAGSSGQGGSSFRDSTGEPSDQPSSLPDDATLAFDSDRRSSGAETPQPLDITGLGTNDTLARGMDPRGRAAGTIRPGESMLVGDESVRLRAFLLAEPDPAKTAEVDYAIEGEAGKGGMGVVYKARQQSLDRLVAIKQIKSDLGASDSDRNKFVSEAVITGQLEHPNIAPVHDLGLAGDGLPFYAMKFVEGEDWEDSIKDKSEEENLTILIQVAQAIAFAHSKNILHRDLKPGNVRLGSFGEVLVMDWGLAARLDDGSEIQPAGTPIYMPPETALEYLDYAKGKVVGGKKIGSSRRRVPAGTYCDIYLLGALLFKIVTGRAPHRGKTTFECLRNAAKNEILKVRRSSELLDIAYRAMATEPEDRYETALDFIDAIRAYQSHAQSIQIAKRASKDLREAGRLIEGAQADPTELYALFSSAQNGYQNALELWEGNRKAQRRLRKAKRLFAETAYGNGDYDLAVSLLDDQSEDDAELRTQVAKSQKSRSARLAWFRTLQYATAASLLVALGFIGYSFVLKQDALSLASELETTQGQIEETIALVEEKEREAVRLTGLAEEQQKLAEEKTVEVQRLTNVAQEKSTEAERATTRALQSEKLADAKQRLAEAATRLASEKTAEATRQSYFAALGRLRATLADSGEYAAWKELQDVDPEVAATGGNDPEWSYLVNAVDWRDEADELVSERPDGATHATQTATSSNGQWLVTATPSAVGKTVLTLAPTDAGGPGQPAALVEGEVDRLTLDATGRYAALAGDVLRVVDLKTGEILASEDSPERVTSVAFHPTENELLLGLEGSAVQRWAIDNSALRRLDSESQWHRVAVTAVGYSPDGVQRFSADESGRIVVWRLEQGEWTARRTLRHAGSGSPRVTSAAMRDDAAGRLAYGCDDGAVYELFGWWDAPADESGYGDASSERLQAMHPAAVTDLCYTSEGARIVTTGGDTILVRQSPSHAGEATSVVRRERRYHDSTVLSCAIGPDGACFTSDEKGRVLRWRLDTPPHAIMLQPRRGEAGVAAVRVSHGASGESVSVADRAGFVRDWSDLSRPQDLQLHYTGHADHREMRAWRLAGEPERFVTVAADNHACVWNAAGGLIERTIDLGGRTVVAVDGASRTLYAASDGRPVEGAAAMAWPIDGGAARPLWDRADRVAVIETLPSGKLAVGLRDGQVYLWSPETGREDRVRSSGRPHWRAITAMTHHAPTGRLYTADAAGLVAAWDLSTNTDPIERLLEADSQQPQPIAKLAVAPDGGVLVLQGRGAGLAPRRLDAELQDTPSPNLALAGLVDADFDHDASRLIGIQRRGAKPRFIAWAPGAGWREAAVQTPASARVEGLRTNDSGLLEWGGGVVRWRPRENVRRIATRLVSRPRAISFVGDDDREGVLTQIGSIDRWLSQTDSVHQRLLGASGELQGSCSGPDTDQAILAVATPAGGSRIELWDTKRTQRLELLGELPSKVASVTLCGDRVLALSDQQVDLIPMRGDPVESIRLPADAGRPISATASEGAGLVAIANRGGEGFVARRERAGGWRLDRLDRDDLTSVAFTPDGRRLLVGVRSGRVLMLGLEEPAEGVRPTRTILSFSGHRDAVTLLQVAQSAEGSRLVSGDASGRVVVRSL